MSEQDFDSLWENMNSAWQWLDPKETYYQYSLASSNVDGKQQDGQSVSWPPEDQFGSADRSFNLEGSRIPSNQVNNTSNKTSAVDDQGGPDCSGWEDNFDSVMQWFDSREKNTCSQKKSASKSCKQSSSEWTESGNFRYVFLPEQYDKWCNVEGWNDEWGKFGGGYDDEKVDPILISSKNPIQPSVPIDDYYNSSEGAGAELYSSSLTDPKCCDPYDWPNGQGCDVGWHQGTSQDWSERACCSWPVGSWDWAQYPQYPKSYARHSPGHDHVSLNCSPNVTKGNSEKNLKYNITVHEKNNNGVQVLNENGERAKSVPPKKKKKKPKKKKKTQSNHQLEENDFGLAHGLPHQDWCEQVTNHYAWDRWSRLELLYHHADLYWQNLPNQYEQLYYEDALLRKEEEEFWFRQEMHARSADRQFYNRPNSNEKLVKEHEPCTNSGALNDELNYFVNSSYIQSTSTAN